MVKPPAKISPSYLENAALHYLQRYASSTANLRRVLLRKVERSLAHWGGEREGMAAQVETVIGKLAGLGYLDDVAYAAQKVRSLHRQGKAGRVIRAALAAKGVDAELAGQAWGALAEEVAEPDLAAAIRLAKKRRLGPFRAENRAELRRKDMATLARAGFGFDIVRRVIEADGSDDFD